MIITLNFNNYKSIVFNPLQEHEGGLRWSYFNVYFLLDLRNIYQAYYNHGGFNDMKELRDFCNANGILSENGESWTVRKLLEYYNCLKKLSFLKDRYAIRGDIFNGARTKSLTENDKNIFIEAFKKYIRFKEFHNLFDLGTDGTGYIYASKVNCRFFNRFYSPKSQIEHIIDMGSSDIMRFWDVYVKWGEELDVLKKIHLKSLNIKVPINLKDTIMVYMRHDMPSDFSVLTFCEEEYGPDYVYIPQLYWMIACKFGYEIGAIHNKLIQECIKPDAKYILQRASGVFIDNLEFKFLPKIGNTYMSHLLKT